MKPIETNTHYSANREEADARKAGGGPAAPPPLGGRGALSQYTGRPVAEGIPGGSSSSESTPQDLLGGSDRSRENDNHG